MDSNSIEDSNEPATIDLDVHRDDEFTQGHIRWWNH